MTTFKVAAVQASPVFLDLRLLAALAHELVLGHGLPPVVSSRLSAPDEEDLSSSDDQSSDPGKT